jgi:glycosyltransferase involved in cell wall biosynthesis
LFLGLRDDVAQLMTAFDVMILPSRFEGIPVTAVEAQASGLPVLASDAVPGETKILSSFEELPLRAGPKIWAERALQKAEQPVDRSTYDQIVRAGYDITENAACLQKKYQTMVGDVM